MIAVLLGVGIPLAYVAIAVAVTYHMSYLEGSRKAPWNSRVDGPALKVLGSIFWPVAWVIVLIVLAFTAVNKAGRKAGENSVRKEPSRGDTWRT